MISIDPEALTKWPGPRARDVADFDPGKPLLANAECEKYMCKFGAAPATEAVRISLTEAVHRPGETPLRLAFPELIRTRSGGHQKPFQFVNEPIILQATPTALYAYKTGQMLQIEGQHFAPFLPAMGKARLRCRFGGTSLEGTGAIITDAMLISRPHADGNERLECEVPAQVAPSAIRVSPRVYVEGTELLASVQGNAVSGQRPRRRVKRLACFPVGLNESEMENSTGLEDTSDSAMMRRLSSFVADDSDMPNASEDSDIMASDNMSEDNMSEEDNMTDDEEGEEDENESNDSNVSTGHAWWYWQPALSSKCIFPYAIDLRKECPSGPPLRTAAEAVVCPQAILEHLERFLRATLALGIEEDYRGRGPQIGWCPSDMNLSMNESPRLSGLGTAGETGDASATELNFLGEEDRFGSDFETSWIGSGQWLEIGTRFGLSLVMLFQRTELNYGSAVHFDGAAWVSEEGHHASCQIDDFFAAMARASLNYSAIIQREARGCAKLGKETLSASTDQIAIMNMTHERQPVLCTCHVPQCIRRANRHAIAVAHLAVMVLGLADRMPERPAFLHWHNRIAIFPAPTVSTIWPRGVSIEQRAHILAYGRHFHPSLEPRCLVQDGNNSWAAFPAVQVSETRLRCLLTPTKYGRHTENLTFAFASRVKVRDCGNESIEMEVWEEYDDDDMMEMGNDSNTSSMSSNTSATRRHGNMTEARAMRPRYFEYTNCSFEVDPVPETHVSDQMVAPLADRQVKFRGDVQDVGYYLSSFLVILPAAHEEASIPASLNPNLVHVAGGAELAIYGNFYGQEDMCGFEGVRQRSRAVRVSNLEIRCQVPPRTVGISRVYLTARDARGLPSVVSANVGMMQLEYIEPVHLYDVEPKQVIDGKSTHLKVHGSNFRPVSALRCGFESRVQRRSLLTHRIPVWTWLGHVQCSSRIAADAIRTFVMFSAEALEPLDRVDPFMCVSYQKDGTWVYHLFDENGVLAEPLLPRLDDALVAEIVGKDIISLERYTGTFAGVHIGYDRGDLEFQPDIDNLTQWMLDRDIELPQRAQRFQDLSHAMVSPGYPAENHICTNHSYHVNGGPQPELQEDDEVENDTNETAPNISLNVTVTKRPTTVRSSTTSFLAPTTTAGPDNSDGIDENVSDDSDDVNESDNASTTTQTTTTSSTTSTTTSSTTTSSTSTSTSTSSTSTTTSSSSTTSSSTSTTTSTSSTSTTSSTSSTTSSTSSTTITSTTTTSSTTSTVTTTDENATWSNYTDDNETLEERIPDIINVWVSGGDFFVNREVGWDTNFVTTEPEYLSRHLILCPTPDGLSWLRKGEDMVKLRVTLNGQEWSDSSLGLTVLHRDVEPEMAEDLVLQPDIPRLEVQGNLSHDPELRFRLAQVTPVVGPSSGGTDLTLTITTWPRLLPDFHFDCVIGLQRVPATLLQIQSSPDFRSYTLGCTVPIAMNIPRSWGPGIGILRRDQAVDGPIMKYSCSMAAPALLALLLSCTGAWAADWEVASVSCEDPSESSGASDGFVCTLAHGALPNADVVAQYQDTVEQVGWAKLHIHGRTRSPSFQISQKDRLKLAFAAGFAEGAMTAKRSYEHKLSYRQAYFKGNYTSYAVAESFLMQNDRFVREKIKSPVDDWWVEIAIVWAQLDGLVAGNAAACGQNCLSLLDFLFFQAEQDLYNVVKVPFAEDEWTLKRAAEFTRETSHCSSIIRLAPNNSDLFVGHNTWTGYYSMLRLLKEYDMPLGGAADKVVFSGYYGQLYSGDDFYTLSSGLTVQETTNSLYNKTTAALIKPESVLTWVVATSKFRPGEEVPDGMLTVLEQMPGIIVWEDVSKLRRSQGFWVSYNSPYFPAIREASGADFMERRYGDSYSYTKNPRARIFARDILKATDLPKVQKLLRYNNWRYDPLSAHGYEGPWEPRAPENAIAARYDLHPWENTTEAFGNTDGKICTASDCQALRFSAISGPTADQQPPFSWTGSPGAQSNSLYVWAFGFGTVCTDVERVISQGADWGVCDSEEDPMLAGSYPVCVRVVPSSAENVFEYEPCQHRFTYIRQPHVDSVSPRSGPNTGGTNVSVHGRYFPEERLGGLLCRFGSQEAGAIAPGRWLSSREITCVTPQSLGKDHGLRTVPVTISINGGADWTPGAIYPEFGPRRGGTLLDAKGSASFDADVHVVRGDGEVETELLNMSQVKSCCFGSPPATIVPAVKDSAAHLPYSLHFRPLLGLGLCA
ncbi:plbB [Symbiodinium sp. KB8]|nr:plbB [Symbiodinium sp. KB8]